MAVEVELSRQAQAMLDEADERWISEHGLEAENPLLDEVARAEDLLGHNPELGVLYRRQAFRRDIRRLLLRSGWQVYYGYDADRALVVIVAIWFATRGAEPPL